MARAPQIERRDRRNTQISTVVGTGGDFHRAVGRSAAVLTSQLNGLDARLTRKAELQKAEDKAARVRASAAQGKSDGFNPDLGPLTLQDDNTAEGRAYNAAAGRTYLARLEMQGRKGLDELAAQYSHDPVQLQEKITAFTEGFGSGVPDSLKPDFALMMGQLAGPYQSEAGRLHRRAVSENDKAVFLDQWSQRSADISRKAYLADGSPESDAALSGDLDGLRALLVQHGPKTAFELDGVKYAPDAGRSGVMDPDAIVESLQDVADDMRTGKVLGPFSRLESETDQAQFMSEFQADYRAGKGEIAKFSPAEYERIVTGMQKTLNGHAAARAKVASEGRGVIRDMRQVISAGFPPDPAAMRELGVMARTSGDAGLRADYRDLQTTLRFSESLQASNPSQVRAVLARAKSSPQGVTAEQAVRLKSAGSFLSKMETALSKDPLEWAGRQGVVDIPVLDFEGDLAAQFAARRGAAEAVSSYYGSDARYFTNDERKALTEFAAAGGDEALAVAQAVNGLDDETGVAMLSEISKTAPVLANLGALMQKEADPILVAQAAEGLSLRASDGFVSRLPAKAELETAVADTFGEAFAALPDAYGAARETAELAFEVDAFRRGVAPGEVGTDGDKVMRENLQKALGATYGKNPIFGGQERFGGTGEVRGRKIIAPRFLRHDKVENVIDRLDADQWAKAGGGAPVDVSGEVLTVEDLKGAYLVSVGDGQYRVSLTDPYAVGAQYVGSGNPDNPLFILNLNALEDDLRGDDKIAKWMIGGG